MIAVAEAFGKLPYEVEELDPYELAEILAFFNLREQDRKKELDKQNRKNRPVGGGRPPVRRGRRR